MRTRVSGLVAALTASIVWIGATACGDSPTEPAPALEIVMTGGDGQYGGAGQRLDEPLEAVVRRVDTGTPQASIVVDWAVVSGEASLHVASAATDAEGGVRATVTLGSSPDTVRVRAAVHDQLEASVTFLAYAIDPPRISMLSRDTARAGDTIAVTGEGFSPTPAQDVVLFSGIRGSVIEATPTELRVEIPPCLPSRVVGVTVQLGTVVSSAVVMSVEESGEVTTIPVGAYVDVDETAHIECLRLPGNGAGYLVMPIAAGTVGAARYDFVLTGLQEGTPPATTPSAVMSFPAVGTAPFPARWEAALREREDMLARAAPRRAPRAAPEGVTPSVPAVGTRRTFTVWNAVGAFDTVSAVARVVSTRAVIYVDEAAPAQGYTDQDLEEFAEAFDGVIYPTDTETFGVPSDLDGNDRVVILFTPTVNRHTERGSSGFVGGFFYGLDLLDAEGSNHAEVFYSLVPDPDGLYSDPRGKDRILDVVPAILAHEFQHMIHFNERVLKRGAPGTEALWLSEGLAQMAEELVARAYQQRGESARAQLFRDGNDDRARRYLARPDETSLIVATGQGTLEERGAGWLFVLYLWDLGGGNAALRELTQTTRTGTVNVEGVTGRPWEETLSDWGTALYLDGGAAESLPFQYPTVDLRDRLSGPGEPFPLTPEVVGTVDFTRSGSLWSSSLKHYIVIPPSAGSTVLRLGGAASGNAPVQAGFRLRVVRLY